MTRLIEILKRLSADHLAIRAVEQAWLDWRHEVDVAPGLFSAFAADARVLIGLVRLILIAAASDVVVAIRGGWLPRWGAWTVASAVTFAGLSIGLGDSITAAASFAILFTSMAFGLVLTVALSDDDRTPSLGLFCVVAIAAMVGQAVRPLLFHSAHPWSLVGMWLIWPACLVLAADRVRREDKRVAFTALLLGSWFIVRMLLGATLGIYGADYDRWLVWLVPTTPVILWWWLVHRQEHLVTEERL